MTETEPYYMRIEREAAERLEALLARPLSDDNQTIDGDDFDPWDMFPVYGCYSSDFDACALDVLREMQSKTKVRDDLGAEMFREMLCKVGLCSYGTSPRVCFPTSRFEKLLPALIEKWEAYSAMMWGRS